MIIDNRHTKALLVALMLAACGGDSSTSSGGGGSIPAGPPPGTPDPTTPVDPVNREPLPGGNFFNNLEGVVSRIRRNLAVDAIPALTDPIFVDAASSEAGYLADDDIVLGLVIGGEARAYPHNIGWSHEITNDTIGGEPVVVTFCPLTGTGMVFDGQNDGGRMVLGVSGNLFNNNLVMYDRRDSRSASTLYPQMLGLGVAGSRQGNELTLIPVVETTWRFWKRLFPGTKVIKADQPESAGNRGGLYDARQYQRYPYSNYRDPLTEPFFETWPTERDNPIRSMFNNKDLVLGVRFGELAKAYAFRAMQPEDVINDTVGGNNIVVVHLAAEQFAVPFSREFNGQTLTFEKVASTDPAVFPFMMRDTETGTTWDLLGLGVDGPNAGQRLFQVPAHNAFWFAWATFWQNTGIY